LAVLVEVGHGDINGGIKGVAEASGVGEVCGSVVEIDEVLSAAGVGKDIDITVHIDIGEREATDAGGLAEGGVVQEVPVAVVDKYSVRNGIVSNGDVEITIVIEVSKLGSVGSGKITTEWPGEIESGASLVKEYEVLLRPVSPICHNDIEITVAIQVPDA
jgi:hypothetical protein